MLHRLLNIDTFTLLYFVVILFPSATTSLSVHPKSKNELINRPPDGSFGSLLRNDIHILDDSNSQSKSNRNLANNNLSNCNNEKEEDRTTRAAVPVSCGAGWQYWCDSCACGFNKLKSYNEHVSGKKHTAVNKESQSLWDAYITSGPAFYDPSVNRADATRAWSLDLFVDGLPARSRSSVRKTVLGLHTSDKRSSSSSGGGGLVGGGNQLDPGIMLRDLPPAKRAALWRFLRDVSPGLARMVAIVPPQYARVKELLESAEAFAHVKKLVKRSTQDGIKATRLSHIYDIGCGHGLVGMLCASAFPRIQVHALDREPRASFQAQREAFVSSGTSLDNLTFQAGDLADLEHTADEEIADDSHSLLLCVHGCKSLTHESIELATRKHWGWLALPCCLQSEHHLDGTTLKVPDDSIRFALLCGALAANHKAEHVAYIDPRITARGIVLSSCGLKE